MGELFGQGNILGADEQLYYPPVQEETAIEVDYLIPKLVKVGYLSISLVTAEGQEIVMADADTLRDWSGYLEIDQYPDAVLLITGYACYNYSDQVSYRYLVENTQRMSGGMVSYTLDEIERKTIGQVNADYVQGFYVKLPLSDLKPGSNTLRLIGDTTQVVIDGWVMEEYLEIQMYGVEDENYFDNIYPPVDMTSDTDHTVEEDTTELAVEYPIVD